MDRIMSFTALVTVTVISLVVATAAIFGDTPVRSSPALTVTANAEGDDTVVLNKITANLMVADVNETIDYYRDALGFELVMSIPETGTIDWAMMKSGAAEIMFQSLSSMAGENKIFTDMEIGGSLVLYIDVSDVRAYYEQVKDKVNVFKELHKEFYGAEEFAIRDNNGYFLVFATQGEQPD